MCPVRERSGRKRNRCPGLNGICPFRGRDGSKGLALLAQSLELTGKGLRLSGQCARGLKVTGAAGSRSGDRDILNQILMEFLVNGSQDGQGLLVFLPFLGGGVFLMLLLEPEDAFHNALCGPLLLGAGALPAQSIQHQLKVHLEHQLGGRLRERFVFLLQQLERDKGPAPLLLLSAGQQFLREGLGQDAEGGEGEPLLREHAHMRFCHCDGIHQ